MKLANMRNVQGVGVNTFDPKQNSYPLASGNDVAKDSQSKNSSRYY